MKNLWISLKITLAMCSVLGVGYVLVLRGILAVAGPNGGEADVVTLALGYDIDAIAEKGLTAKDWRSACRTTPRRTRPPARRAG